MTELKLCTYNSKSEKKVPTQNGTDQEGALGSVGVFLKHMEKDGPYRIEYTEYYPALKSMHSDFPL